jgi:ferredoxin--NADP+ reductase
VGELTYGQELFASLKDDPLVRESAQGVRLYNNTTREDYPFMGRITDLMASGKVLTILACH